MEPIVERWLPVVGWEGLYEVSDQGRVRSLDREVPNGRGGVLRLKGKELRWRINPHRGGYATVAPCRAGRNSWCYVHLLVLEAFVGPCPDGMQAAHGDGDVMNNALSNLRWATPPDNANDRKLHGTNRNMPYSLTDEQVVEIKRRYRRGLGVQLGAEFGITNKMVWNIMHGKSYKHVT
jgi:hypothetical protein